MEGTQTQKQGCREAQETLLICYHDEVRTSAPAFSILLVGVLFAVRRAYAEIAGTGSSR